MQTFLPDTNFVRSAELLDRQRLGKQRVEAYQILVALRDPWSVQTYVDRHGKEPGTGWQRHPFTLRWKGYEDSLRYYYRCVVQEWIARGYLNTMPVPTQPYPVPDSPPWLDEAFALEHRQLLYRKNPEFYQHWRFE